jgi:hypothetical protein
MLCENLLLRRIKPSETSRQVTKRPSLLLTGYLRFEEAYASIYLVKQCFPTAWLLGRPILLQIFGNDAPVDIECQKTWIFWGNLFFFSEHNNKLALGPYFVWSYWKGIISAWKSLVQDIYLREKNFKYFTLSCIASSIQKLILSNYVFQ